ncbi:hypothetical protein P12x_003915 [Tundrisphaera lichenicola]|uniref:hypothetical protein n=1 Tax=Tundrisphaera lichenicola TaxID=2029860 RepID=UPI003EBFD477
MSGGADGLEVPGPTTPAEHALDIAEFGIGQPDLAERPSTDPDRAKRQLDHPDGGISLTLDLEEGSFRHRGAFSRLRRVWGGSRDPVCSHGWASG